MRIKKILFIMFIILFICPCAMGAWQTHYWTADEVEKYQTHSVDLVGTAWWYRHIPGTNDVSNMAEVGEKPLYLKLWISPRPYVPGSGQFGRADVRMTTDLMGEWKEFGRFRNWQANKPWRYITVAVWDEKFANEIRESDTFFLDVGTLTNIRKVQLCDGTNVVTIIDKITPKEPQKEFDVEAYLRLKAEKETELDSPEAVSIAPPIPGS